MKYTVVAFTCVMGIFALSSHAGTGKLNDDCRVVSHCDKFGYFCAQNRTCQCRPQYEPNKYRDKCVGFVNQLCKYDEHCIEGAYCEKQLKCKCKEGFSPDADNHCSLTSKNSATSLIAAPAVLLVVFKLYI